MNEVQPSQVIVGVTGSPAGLQALRYAVAEARRRHAVLTIVHVYRNSACSDPAVLGAMGDARAQAAFERLRTWLDEALGGPPTDLAGRHLVAVGGAPGPVLLDRVRAENDLLVVGASRRRFGVLRGRGVAAYCSRRATCPVLLVPPPEMARALRRRMGTRRQFERALEAELRVGVQ